MCTQLYNEFLNSKGVSIDTRTIQSGMIFFALTEGKTDGSLYINTALEKGAALVITENPEYSEHPKCVVVDSTLFVLSELAKEHRRNLKSKVIAITGSNGKTTTKELLSVVLATTYKTSSTKGNLNNHIGVPLTILNSSPDSEFLIVEMGANHIGEIASLCNIAMPDYGIITNIGQAHLQGFGSPEGVFQAKTELYRYIAEYGKMVFVNSDDEKLVSASKDLSTFSYGKEYGFVTGNIVQSFPSITAEWKYESLTNIINTHLFGSVNLYNILAAISVGVFFNVSSENLNKAISTYLPDNNRSQIKKTTLSNTLILDAYNANPSSMNIALDEFGTMPYENKCVILGAMLELGDFSDEKHKQIIEKTLANHFQKVIFVGEFFCKFKEDFSHKANFFNNTTDAEVFLKQNQISSSIILLKGSRGIALEKLVHLL